MPLGVPDSAGDALPARDVLGDALKLPDVDAESVPVGVREGVSSLLRKGVTLGVSDALAEPV